MSYRLITRFADDMARELDANDWKVGWDTMGTRRLLVRAEQEMGELRRAIEKGKSFEDIRSEAADVGNFLAMLVWNACIESEDALTGGLPMSANPSRGMTENQSPARSINLFPRQ